MIVVAAMIATLTMMETTREAEITATPVAMVGAGKRIDQETCGSHTSASFFDSYL
jgi:hypothetical protein